MSYDSLNKSRATFELEKYNISNLKLQFFMYLECGGYRQGKFSTKLFSIEYAYKICIQFHDMHMARFHF